MTSATIDEPARPGTVRVWANYGAVVGFAGFAIAGVSLRPLLPVDETRYLSVAWEMWQSGDLLVPTLNGELYTHKPPLLFWLINAVWAVIGVSEFAARLVAPAFGVAAILLTARLERRLWPDIAPRAALVLATTGVFLVFASLTMFDAMLTVAVLTGVLALWRASREGGVLPWAAFGFALALGTLAKGPVILIHLLPLALAMPLWAHQKARLARWYLGLLFAFAFALVLVSIWLVPALIAGGEAYQEAVLWKQSAGRMVKSFAHRQPIWFFLALVPVFLWPWGWSLAFWATLRDSKPLRDPTIRLCILWIALPFVIFSLISGKQLHYLIPELPAFALIISRYAPELGGRKDWILPIFPLALALLAVCILASGVVPIRKLQELDLDLNRIGLAAAFALCAGVTFLLSKRRNIALASLAPAMVASLYLVASSEISRVYAPYAIASELKLRETQGIAHIGGRYHGEFTFAGRLTQPIAVIEGPAATASWTSAHPGGVLFGRGERMPSGVLCNQHHIFRGRSYCLSIVPVSQ